jgi:Mrp family chromosome partitioning ATPase
MFDVIIIDTPPVTVVSDALALCKRVDGVLVVAANNKTTYPEVQEAIKNLKFAEAKILGIVYNRAKTKISGRNKKYSNYYSSNVD